MMYNLKHSLFMVIRADGSPWDPLEIQRLWEKREDKETRVRAGLREFQDNRGLLDCWALQSSHFAQ